MANKKTIPLTDTAVKALKPKERDFTVADGNGLQLKIKIDGKKIWEVRYTINGKPKQTSIGSYPTVTLKKARDKNLEIRQAVAEGIDPVQQRKEAKQAKQAETENAKDTFRAVSQAFLKKQSTSLAEVTLRKHTRALERDFYPFIGTTPIRDITRQDLLVIAQKIQERGALETAHRLLWLCSQIWEFATIQGKVERNIVREVKLAKALKAAPRAKSYKTILDPVRIGELMRAIDAYQGEIVTRAALKLISLTAVRTQNIRFAQWEEFDLDSAMWTIPAYKMKMKNRGDFTVYLSTQAVQVLKDIEPYTRGAKYVFHSSLGTTRPLSENTINQALKRLDFGSEIVGHGFRSMFSTLANESGLFRSEVIEAVLAHEKMDKVEASYNRAEYVQERKVLMQWWADHLEVLK